MLEVEGMEPDGKVGEEVCVTGASGFIGSTLVRLLLRRGYTVRGTVQNLQNEKETRHLEALERADSSFRLYQIDLLDYDSIFSAINGVVGVFHLASPCTVDQVTDPQRELLEPAIQGTLNVLKAAKASGVKRVVVTSSISAIVPSPGWPADVVKGEDCWTDVEYCKQNGLWYSASKTLAEKEAWRFAEETGLNVVVVNPGTVLGPILPPAINASMGVLLGLLQGRHLCVESITHYSDFVDMVARLYPEYNLPRFTEETQPGLLRASNASKKLIDLGMEFVPLEQTIKDSMASLREKGFLN